MSTLDFYIIYILAILPSILILYYVFKRDRFQEDKKEVIITFFLGSSTVLVLDLLIPITEAFADSFFSGIAKDAFIMYFRAATLEESVKMLVLYFYAYRLGNFNEPMDAIVFATAASVGFAAIENVDYVFSGETQNQSFNIAFVRAFSAVPLHALCGIIMGTFFGLAIFATKNNKRYLFLSLALPILIHGSYNFVLTLGMSLLIYVLLIFLVIKSSNILNALNYDQSMRSNEEVIKIYDIEQDEIYFNLLQITGIIILVVITLEVFT